jgi:hypothetical protein
MTPSQLTGHVQRPRRLDPEDLATVERDWPEVGARELIGPTLVGLTVGLEVPNIEEAERPMVHGNRSGSLPSRG